MVIAVIGANGFIGSNLSKELLQLGHTVYSVYHRSIDRIPKGTVCVTLDELYKAKFQFDIIYLAMGNYANSKSEFIGQAFVINNIVSGLQFKKIVYISSIAVYGAHNSVIRLTSSYNQPSAYGLAKLMNEFVISMCPDYSILRLTYIYGVGMGKNSILPKWVNDALTKKQITVFGDGSRTQDYLHITDAVDLCIKAGLHEGNNTFIGATGHSVSNISLAKLISSHIPGSTTLLSESDTAPSFSYDVKEARQLIGWQPQINIEQGIEELIHYESSRIQ